MMARKPRMQSFLEHQQVQNIVSNLMESEQGQRLVAQGAELITKFNEVVAKIAAGELPQPQQVKGAAKVVQRVVKRGPTPREILHFGPAEVLTVEKVKERKKALARFVHPDTGGATESMVAINQAADALLKELS